MSIYIENEIDTLRTCVFLLRSNFSNQVHLKVKYRNDIYINSNYIKLLIEVNVRYIHNCCNSIRNTSSGIMNDTFQI